MTSWADDPVVVVGGDGLHNVHVHTDDVGAAIEAGIAIGRPHRIRVTHFADMAPRERTSGRAVIAVAAGPGLSDLFRESGALVLQGGPGRRCSTGGMPRPESELAKPTCPARASTAPTTSPPPGRYLIALVTRLSRTWRTRARSSPV